MHGDTCTRLDLTSNELKCVCLLTIVRLRIGIVSMNYPDLMLSLAVVLLNPQSPSTVETLIRILNFGEVSNHNKSFDLRSGDSLQYFTKLVTTAEDLFPIHLQWWGRWYWIEMDSSHFPASLLPCMKMSIYKFNLLLLSLGCCLDIVIKEWTPDFNKYSDTVPGTYDFCSQKC